MKQNRRGFLALMAIAAFLVFMTEAFAAGPIEIGIYGDTRANIPIHTKIVKQLEAAKPEAVFFMGDFVLDGNVKSQWDEVHNLLVPIRKMSRYFPIAGNHEKESAIYYNEFEPELEGRRWFSVDVGNTHFVLLNSNLDLKPGSEQYAWLEEDLQMLPRDKFLMVMLHHPLFNAGFHAKDKLVFKEPLLSLFDRYKVDVVMSGHDHNYQRFQWKNTSYLVIGGGGAPLAAQTEDGPLLKRFLKSYCYVRMQITEEKLIITTYDADGSKIDNLTIEK